MEPSEAPQTTSLILRPDPFTFTTLAEVREFAKEVSDSGMFGIKKPSQAITMLKLAHDEGYTLMQCLQRFHFFEDGKISQRADWTDSDFKKRGWILWHVRSDEMCAASFGLGKAPDVEARKRALKRFELQWELEDEGMKPEARTKTMLEIAQNTFSDETTILRTYEDAEAKGLTEGRNGTKDNWKKNPRAMLSARVVTEGVKVVSPGSAPFASEDETIDIQRAEAADRVATVQIMGEKEKLEWQITETLSKAELAGTPTEKSRLLGVASDLRTQLHEKYPPDGVKMPASDSGGVEPAPTVSNAAPAGTAAQDAAQETILEPPPAPDWRKYKIKMVKAAAYKGRTLEELTEEEIKVLYEKRGLPKLEDPDKGIREEARMFTLAYEEYQKIKSSQR